MITSQARQSCTTRKQPGSSPQSFHQPKPVSQFPTSLGPKGTNPSFTIRGTSARPKEEDLDLRDVSVAYIKRQQEWACEQYNDAFKGGHEPVAQYWDGYIRALQHVLEARYE